jgi:tetratricopeptide (TPR) repeat protein
MADDLRSQIYNNLVIRDTEDLLEIWQDGDTAQWSEEALEVVEEILIQRLGEVPPQSSQTQHRQSIARMERYLENKELDRALSECELAIQLNPTSADAYNSRGIIYDEMGQLENAISSYQKAIQLDPEFRDAWANLSGVEAELEMAFMESAAKLHLDQALEYAYSDEPEAALEECETAKGAMPGIAIAYNYLGLVLETLDRLEDAIEAYLTAIQANPRFFAARENLANARVRLEEEQYLRMSAMDLRQASAEFYEALYSEPLEAGMPIPGWMYLDAEAFILKGWAGHRTRPGRTGYDPLDRDFELAHVEGVILRRLFTGRFRTRNPVFLFIMACMGVVYSFYGLFPLVLADPGTIVVAIADIPYAVLGMAILYNVYLSLRLESPNPEEEKGFTFI